MDGSCPRRRLEVQEAALTGESAPVAKEAGAVLDVDTALGDRTNLVFQNTQVTRGTATSVVVATGESTQMGQIADMVTATKRSRSPLQDELDGMTKVFGTVAWLAVMVIAIFGIVRGQNTETLVLLCVSTAISAIPTGLPTFVQTMLSSGAQHLAESKAVVKSLTDVETLGGTTAINSDKTGTLTLNAMTATTMLAGGDWFQVQGGGYSKSGAITGVAGTENPDFQRLALGLTLCSDATVADDESIIGDPTEAALVVLAAKMGVDAEADARRSVTVRGGAVRLRVQVHGDIPRSPRLAVRRSTAGAALHDREGCSRYRDGPGAAVHSGTTSRSPLRASARRSLPPTSSSRKRASGCSPSRRATSMTPRCSPPSRIPCHR